MITKWTRMWLFGLTAAGLLAAGAAIAASFDSPDGEPPFGLEFPDGRSGQAFDGVATIVFRGMVNTNAASLESVVRFRKGGELHVFYTDYDCDPLPPAPCPSICSSSGIDVTNVAGVQLCIESLIEPEVVADFGLGTADVRLKDVSDFKDEPHPADGSILVVASDVVVTAR